MADAQHFLDAPSGGTENSEGEVGIYRYRELKSSGTETFVLESLLPGTGYDVHISKMKLRGEESRIVKPHPTNQPPVTAPTSTARRSSADSRRDHPFRVRRSAPRWTQRKHSSRVCYLPSAFCLRSRHARRRNQRKRHEKD